MAAAEEGAFDEAAAHRHFSKRCFNATWALIEKPDRTPADDEAMILANQASLWHWSQRPDCTDRHRAIGYWQASRVRALVGHGPEALRYAQLCFDHAGGLPAFYRASAHEALARASLACGDRAAGQRYAALARELADTVDDSEDREIIENDLAALAGLHVR